MQRWKLVKSKFYQLIRERIKVYNIKYDDGMMSKIELRENFLFDLEFILCGDIDYLIIII